MLLFLIFLLLSVNTVAMDKDANAPQNEAPDVFLSEPSLRRVDRWHGARTCYIRSEDLHQSDVVPHRQKKFDWETRIDKFIKFVSILFKRNTRF